jgi:hypothetical protein
MVLSMDSIGYQDWDCVFLLYVVPFMFWSLFSTHPLNHCVVMCSWSSQIWMEIQREMTGSETTNTIIMDMCLRFIA